jgi:ammonia channel protein AmtB
MMFGGTYRPIDCSAKYLPAGFLVFMMQLGFALLTIGCVQRKSAKSICLKNILVSAFLQKR